MRSLRVVCCCGLSAALLVASLGACQPSRRAAPLLSAAPAQAVAQVVRWFDDCSRARFPSDHIRCAAESRFDEPACAAAFAQLAQVYHYQRGYAAYPIHRLLNACGRAYCPRLPTPRPRICGQLPVAANPAAWFDQVTPLLEAIDGLIGGQASTLLHGIGSRYGYCRGTRARTVPVQGVVLHLRYERGELRVRASGRVRGRWTLKPPWATAARPVLDRLHRAHAQGSISLKLENVVPAQAPEQLITALNVAGWCGVSTLTSATAGPGGWRCPRSRVAQATPESTFMDAGPLGAAVSVTVTETALLYRGRSVVPLTGGRVPPRFFTDGPQGHLIHPFRQALLEDLQKQRVPTQLAITLAPGVTLSNRLFFSLHESALNALAQSGRGHRSVGISVQCQ